MIFPKVVLRILRRSIALLSSTKSEHGYRAEHVVCAEREFIGENPTHGLCLSGGGIRSAAFSLGVIQYLGQRNLLKKFHYLSTVSGGGYIGSALTWWLHQGYMVPKDSMTKKSTTTPSYFPFGDETNLHCVTPRPSEIVSHLRSHANFLLPTAGLNVLSLIAVLLRNTLVFLIVILSLFVSIVHLVYFGNTLISFAVEFFEDNLALPFISSTGHSSKVLLFILSFCAIVIVFALLFVVVRCLFGTGAIKIRRAALVLMTVFAYCILIVTTRPLVDHCCSFRIAFGSSVCSRAAVL